MQKKIVIILSLVLAALVLTAGGLAFFNTYLFLDGQLYRRDVAALDLSGAPLPELEALKELKELKQLDLRETGLTAEQYDTLQAALPECQIQWLVPFQGSALPLDTQRITLSALTDADIARLAYLPDLQTVDATDCADLEALQKLRDAYPQVQVLYRLTLGEQVLNQDAQSAALTDISHIEQALTYLPELKALDATGCTDLDGLLRLRQAYPGCAITYQVSIGGQTVPNDAASITLDSVTAQELEAVLPYLPQLTEVTVQAPISDAERMPSVTADHPGIAFTYSFDLLGKTVSNRDTALDLSNIPLDSTAPIEAAMAHFAAMEKIDMCGCGIADEDMAQLNERYPDTLFVWTITLGGWLKLRTDITTFMPYQYDYNVSDADADKLKYLTELVCLDFGHMPITRTDYLQHMTKMQYLLLADTEISDISAVANMPDLVFCEIFMTKVRDYTPFLSCKNLQDLNISFNYPTDINVIYQLTWLERLWFKGCPKPHRGPLAEALSNTATRLDSGSATGDGWRESPNYFAMRDLLGMGYMTT